MRIFTAFPVSPEVVAEVIRLQREIKFLNKKLPVRWTTAENLHVTLEFLGELNEEQLRQVQDILRTATMGRPAFNYWLDNLDGFPNLARPKIITLKIGEEHYASRKLRDDIFAKLFAARLIGETHTFTPHLTIGRLKKDWAGIVFPAKINQLTWPVERLDLFKSELRHGGPVYTLIESFKLS